MIWKRCNFFHIHRNIIKLCIFEKRSTSSLDSWFQKTKIMNLWCHKSTLERFSKTKFSYFDFQNIMVLKNRKCEVKVEIFCFSLQKSRELPEYFSKTYTFSILWLLWKKLQYFENRLHNVQKRHYCSWEMITFKFQLNRYQMPSGATCAGCLS